MFNREGAQQFSSKLGGGGGGVNREITVANSKLFAGFDV
jgi:hypothetical protein